MTKQHIAKSGSVCAASITNILFQIWLEVNFLIKTSQLRVHKKWTSAKPVAGSQVAAALNDSSANYQSQLIGFMTGPNMTTFPMVLQTVSSKTHPCTIHLEYFSISRPPTGFFG